MHSKIVYTAQYIFFFSTINTGILVVDILFVVLFISLYLSSSMTRQKKNDITYEPSITNQVSSELVLFAQTVTEDSQIL